MRDGDSATAEGAPQLPPGRVPVVARINNVKFRQMVRPGDMLEIEVELTEILAEAYFLKAKIRVAEKIAVQFDFVCTLAAI